MKSTRIIFAFLLLLLAVEANAANASLGKAPERFVLDNGIPVHFVANNELPLLRVAVIVRGGSVNDPEGLEGTAGLMFSAMRLGTSTYPVQDIDNRLDALAIDISITTGEEYSIIELATLKENVDEALNILASVITEPSVVTSGWSLTNRFKTNKGIATLKEISKDNIRRLKDNQQALVIKHFSRLMYNGTNRQRMASLKSIDAITKSDLASLYKGVVTPRRIQIAASGAISAAELQRKLNGALGGWQATGFAITAEKMPAKPNGAVYFIVKDSPQSIIVKGFWAPRKASEHAYDFEIINNIIGGEGHISRLFRQIRTEHGYAYATGSFYRQGYELGLMGVYAFVRAENTIPVLEMINKILAGSREEGFSSEEVTITKNSIRNRFVFTFASPFDLAMKFAEIEYANLPADFYTGYLKRIEAVDEAKMREVAATYISEQEALTIIIGPQEQLTKLQETHGKITVIEGNGY
ncbi:MAG: insulinase family protein [Deltaproteobacteria bacterium]|nr:insulinase family protein [Deltaproteobacteria bacterium]